MEALQLYKGRLRQVRLFPDPVLKTRCDEVRNITGQTVNLFEDMIQTMLALPRCVGLAAPQVGEATRVVVLDVSRHPKAPERNHGLLCLINPVVVRRAGEVVTREGCVSVPDFTANVRRSERVAIDFIDLDGRCRAIEALGFEAIALQHEIDHLDGLLFLDRVDAGDIFRRKRK